MAKRSPLNKRFSHLVNLPVEWLNQMEVCFDKQGVQPRQRSRWIESQLNLMQTIGIEQLLSDSVLERGVLDRGVPMIARKYILSDDADALLKNLLVMLRIHDPLMEYDKSTIIRAAIRFGLDRCDE